MGFNALKLNSTEKELALDIEKRAAIKGYLKIPEGWYVPLSDIRANIDIVVEFNWHETLHYGEFEIIGDILIIVSFNE